MDKEQTAITEFIKNYKTKHSKKEQRSQKIKSIFKKVECDFLYKKLL